MASATVLTRLAPMASRQSTCRCTTSRRSTARSAGELASPSQTRTSSARGPPPRVTSRGTAAQARARISASWARMRAAEAAGSATPTSSTWAVITGASASASKPPAARTMRAAFEAAAITEGSSTAMGTR